MKWHHYTSLLGLEAILNVGEIRSMKEIMKAQLHRDNPPEKVEEILEAISKTYNEKERRRRSNTYLINEKRAVDCQCDQVLITIDEDIEPNYGSNMLEIPKISLDNIVEIGAIPQIFPLVKSTVKKNPEYKDVPVYKLA